jgi:uncharacterized delta-60 repeat protein/RHS repeat-associated protein
LANGASGMARFTSSGALDTTFGSGGTGKVALTGDYDQSINLESLSDQRLLVSGVSAGEMVLHRFTADGLEDDTFGTSGTVTMAFGAWHIDWGYDVGVQPDGKVIVVGLSNFSGGDGFALRYNVDGTLDTSFGSSGAMLVWYGSSSYSEWDYFQSVAIQKDGQIVAVGTANGEFAVARMNGGLTRLYAEQDANYNVTSVEDVSGNVKQRLIYSSFGVMTVLSPTWGNTTDGYGWQYTFQDGRYDAVSGDIIYDLRVYNPHTGTWLQQDPTAGMYIDGPDLYQVENSNPIYSGDPSGLDGRIHDPYKRPKSHGPRDMTGPEGPRQPGDPSKGAWNRTTHAPTGTALQNIKTAICLLKATGDPDLIRKAGRIEQMLNNGQILTDNLGYADGSNTFGETPRWENGGNHIVLDRDFADGADPKNQIGLATLAETLVHELYHYDDFNSDEPGVNTVNTIIWGHVAMIIPWWFDDDGMSVSNFRSLGEYFAHNVGIDARKQVLKELQKRGGSPCTKCPTTQATQPSSRPTP